MSKSLKITFLLTFLLQILRGQNGYQNLIKKGISTQRLQTKGFGATQPISEEKTDENRRLNRRIEFEIIGE